MTIAYSGDSITFPDNSVQATAATGFGFKSRIFNGNMAIDQRNAGASVTAVTGGQYSLDRWNTSVTASSKFSIQQNAGAVATPAGFPNYLGVTSLLATSLAGSDFYSIRYQFEGFSTADLNWGTASAAPVTLSFVVRSSLTGTFGGSIKNNANDRSYPFSYTISAANTWETKTITIQGDTTGTWPGAVNTRSLQLSFGLGVGTTQSGTAGAWAAGNFTSVTGAVSVVGTSGATWYVTGVQLEKGSTATSFDYRPYGTELALCQRYYQHYGVETVFAPVTPMGTANSTTVAAIPFVFPVSVRAIPSVAQSTLMVTDSFNDFAVTTIALAGSQQSKSACTINFTVASGLTQFRPYFIRCNNSTAGFLAISAEL